MPLSLRVYNPKDKPSDVSTRRNSRGTLSKQHIRPRSHLSSDNRTEARDVGNKMIVIC